MSRDRRLAVVLALDLALVVALVMVGLRAHSLAVLAAGADYLADAAAAGLSLLALWLGRRPPSARHPRGFGRASSYAALVNAGWLLAVSGGVVIGAVRRLSTGTVEIDAGPVIVVSAIAALVMAGAVVVLQVDDDDGDGDDGDDDDGEAMAMRAVVLDTIADVASATGVAVTGLVILGTHGWFWLDPAVALVIAVIVGWHAIALLRDVVASLRRPSAQRR